MTMGDAERLLQEFIAADRGGEADPLEFLARAQGRERDRLEALIDAYLERAPRRRFDPAAFAVSPARSVADGLARTLGGASGTWPALLPRLRHRASLRRAEVVERLAAELGVAGVEKLGRYYHRMEQGSLPAAGVSERVLEALARVVGTTAEHLREAGAAAGTPGADPAAGAAAFARVGTPDPAQVPAEALQGREPAGAEPADEIDALFTGASAT